MKAIEIDGIEESSSMDEFLQTFTSDNDSSDAASFTAKVVMDSLDRLFPDEGRLRKLMMVTNITNYQMTHIIKSLHSAYVLGLCYDKLGRNSVFVSQVFHQF
jgi:hypothetical protein